MFCIIFRVLSINTKKSSFALEFPFNPTDTSCILSTLSFLSKLAHQSNRPIIIAFNQPLYWKGNRLILESTDQLIKEIVLMLGNFHTIFNLLGCIGFLMAGSGLRNLLGEIYVQLLKCSLSKHIPERYVDIGWLIRFYLLRCLRRRCSITIITEILMRLQNSLKFYVTVFFHL